MEAVTLNGTSSKADVRTVKVVDDGAYLDLMDRLESVSSVRDDEREDAKRLRLLRKYQAGLCTPKRLVQADSSVTRRLNACIESAPNAKTVLLDIVGQVRLQELVGRQHLRMPLPVLLLGDPGVGKSMVARLIPRVLGLEHESVHLGGLAEAFAWVGLDLGYVTGKEGLLTQMLARHEVANWIMVMDELDKGCAPRGDRTPAYEPLLQLMEKSTASAIRDIALDIDLNLSWLGEVVATANEPELIPPPLRDRFVIYTIPAPTPDEMDAIVRAIWRDICRDEGWDSVLSIELDDAVVDRLRRCTPRQARKALLQGASRRGVRLSKRPSSGDLVRIESSDLDGGVLGEQSRRRAIGFHAKF